MIAQLSAMPNRFKFFLVLGLLLLPLIHFVYVYRDIFLKKREHSNGNNKLTETPSKTTITQSNTNIQSIDQARLEACENGLNKCRLNKLRVVIIDTAATHLEVRQLVGSLHHHHKGDIKAVIYGLNLPTSNVNEVLLWENVEYIDLEQEFVSAVRIGEQEKAHLNKDLWKPLVLKHSVDGMAYFPILISISVWANLIFGAEFIDNQVNYWIKLFISIGTKWTFLRR
jgi:hypothetical protein